MNLREAINIAESSSHDRSEQIWKFVDESGEKLEFVKELPATLSVFLYAGDMFICDREAVILEGSCVIQTGQKTARVLMVRDLRPDEKIPRPAADVIRESQLARRKDWVKEQTETQARENWLAAMAVSDLFEKRERKMQEREREMEREMEKRVREMLKKVESHTLPPMDPAFNLKPTFLD